MTSHKVSFDIESLRVVYSRRMELYQRLKDELEFIISRELDVAMIRYHTITSRVKTFESFLAKAQRKAIRDPIREIDDICGIRIICLFLSDIERVKASISKAIQVVDTEDKVHEVPPEFFGYMAVHLVAKLPKDFVGPRYNDLKNLRAEIQIRTIAMDAWANVSHYLNYKTSAAVPTGLRKDFHALSGLFYLADTHFEMFFREQKEAREWATKQAEAFETLLDEEINLDTLTVFLQKRYPKSEHSGADRVSRLVHELVTAGYNSLRDVQRDLERTQVAFNAFEQDEITEHAMDGFTDVEELEISLRLLKGGTPYDHLVE